jgi:hypothetical protein
MPKDNRFFTPIYIGVFFLQQKKTLAGFSGKRKYLCAIKREESDGTHPTHSLFDLIFA